VFGIHLFAIDNERIEVHAGIELGTFNGNTTVTLILYRYGSNWNTTHVKNIKRSAYARLGNKISNLSILVKGIG